MLLMLFAISFIWLVILEVTSERSFISVSTCSPPASISAEPSDTVTVESYDRVGNKTNSNNTIEFTVDQSTDNPSITFSNVDASATDYKTNLFGDTKWDVIGTAFDDDGVAKVEVFKGTEKIAEKTYSGTDQKTQVEFTITIPSDKVSLGNNDLKFVVTDNSSKGKSSETTLKIAVDNERPAFDSYEFYMWNGTAYETTPTQWTDPMFATQKHKIKFTVTDDTGFDTGSAIEYYDGTSWVTKNIDLDSDASSEKSILYVAFLSSVLFNTILFINSGSA